MTRRLTHRGEPQVLFNRLSESEPRQFLRRHLGAHQVPALERPAEDRVGVALRGDAAPPWGRDGVRSLETLGTGHSPAHRHVSGTRPFLASPAYTVGRLAQLSRLIVVILMVARDTHGINLGVSVGL